MWLADSLLDTPVWMRVESDDLLHDGYGHSGADLMK
jgi:hypothetical protein